MRVRVFSPVPHVTEHSAQLDQLVQRPSTTSTTETVAKPCSHALLYYNNTCSEILLTVTPLFKRSFKFKKSGQYKNDQ